jgi:hypothetical protein
MAARRLFELARTMEVSEHAQLNVLEAHVRTEPRGTVARLALFAFRRPRRLERGLRREMRFAEERRIVARARERPGETALADAWIEIDAVVPHAVRERKLAGENRSPRRLAY